MLRGVSFLGLIMAPLYLEQGCKPPCVPDEGPYEFCVESGERRTTAGDRIAYDLFIPETSVDLPGPPWPAVIICHGFARDRSRHRCNATYLAERGIVVLTPNLTSLLRGERDQLRNIAGLVDHVAWLIQRTRTEGDVLQGLIDPHRIGLAGHSAGGAITFEAAVESQSTPWPVGAVCLLDAVPWQRTLERTSELVSLPLSSFRSEPAPCNARGAIQELLALLSFPAEDVLIVGAMHCDPESPTSSLCAAACGGTGEDKRRIYQALLYLFLRDALDAPLVDDVHRTYAEALDHWETEGAIARMPTGNAGE